MSAAKTTTERVERLRKDRDAQGLRRRELYLSDDEFEQVKAHIHETRAARKLAIPDLQGQADQAAQKT